MQFQPGQSGNPAGRPRGARNKATVILQALLEGNVEDIGDRLVRRAKLGDIAAIRLCVDRILPRRRDAPVAFELPPIGCAGDLAKAYEALRAGLASGEISAREAFELGRFAERMAASVETRELSERVARLDAALAAIAASAGGARALPSDGGAVRVGHGEGAVAPPTDAASAAPVNNRENTGSASAPTQGEAPVADGDLPGAACAVAPAKPGGAHHGGAASATVEVRSRRSGRVGNGEDAVPNPTDAAAAVPVNNRGNTAVASKPRDGGRAGSLARKGREPGGTGRVLDQGTQKRGRERRPKRRSSADAA